MDILTQTNCPLNGGNLGIYKPNSVINSYLSGTHVTMSL